VFERYTERARRVLFFARYEASQTGSVTIETEHLLLGLIRETKGIVSRVFEATGVSMETLRPDIERRLTFREKVATSVEIPFTEATKRALQQAAVEADGLDHSYIGIEHLLLALLHFPASGAGEILGARGVTYDGVRKDIVRMLDERASLVTPRPNTRTEVVAAIEQIKREVLQLASLIDHAASADPAAVVEPQELADRIRQGLDRLKSIADL
jgi:ATP-dependent Clp protease ATP-binding subunit ClpC